MSSSIKPSRNWASANCYYPPLDSSSTRHGGGYRSRSVSAIFRIVQDSGDANLKAKVCNRNDLNSHLIERLHARMDLQR